uniref:Uncharacterized protein n=1 Tax=Rhabditophanes sp. KR3021 TaxID=114890 RepID=A0AC35THJ6_9BILA
MTNANLKSPVTATQNGDAVRAQRTSSTASCKLHSHRANDPKNAALLILASESFSKKERKSRNEHVNGRCTIS